jgi:allophanate hydrolase
MRVDDGTGRAIEVEVWLMPEDRFGGFVGAVPPPLGIGSVELETGEWVKGFICEPHALRAADDITPFGSWRAFLAEQ